MPGYIAKALKRFNHIKKARPEHAPHAWTVPQYGQKVQYTAPTDNTPPLSPIDIKEVEQLVGVFLYYGRALDNTMLTGLNEISSSQSSATEATMAACTKLLDYAATHPDAVVRFTASGMVLHIHSDASYLSAPKAKSRAGGYFYLSDDPSTLSPDQKPAHNGPIHVLCSLLAPVVASAAEAEVGAAFMCGQEGCPLRQTLIELGHPQPATPIQTDNQCAVGILNGTVKQRRSKAIDMRFYWLQDRIRSGQYSLFWAPGSENLGDYFTKHHAPAHHKRVRPLYLYNPQSNSIQLAEHSTPQALLCEGVLKSLHSTALALEQQPQLNLVLSA